MKGMLLELVRKGYISISRFVPTPVRAVATANRGNADLLLCTILHRSGAHIPDES